MKLYTYINFNANKVLNTLDPVKNAYYDGLRHERIREHYDEQGLPKPEGFRDFDPIWESQKLSRDKSHQFTDNLSKNSAKYHNTRNGAVDQRRFEHNKELEDAENAANQVYWDNPTPETRAAADSAMGNRIRYTKDFGPSGPGMPWMADPNFPNQTGMTEYFKQYEPRPPRPEPVPQSKGNFFTRFFKK